MIIKFYTKYKPISTKHSKHARKYYAYNTTTNRIYSAKSLRELNILLKLHRHLKVNRRTSTGMWSTYLKFSLTLTNQPLREWLLTKHPELLL